MLLRRAGILVENDRPGVMPRLLIDDETLHQANPALVYVSGSRPARRTG